MAETPFVQKLKNAGAIAAVLSPIFIFFFNFYVAYLLRTSSEFTNISVPSIVSFWICAVTVILLGVYKKVSSNALQTESAINLQNSLFFFACAITSFALFRSQDFWPSFLGGNGSVKAIFENYPNVPVPASGIWYFMVFFGYWIHSLRHMKTFDEPENWGPNIITILSACLFFVLFLSNNLRFFLVFSFILSVVNVWVYFDAFLFGKDRRVKSALLQAISSGLAMILSIALKIVVFGVLVVNFWMAEGNTKSWALKLDMNLIRLILTVLWCFYVVLFCGLLMSFFTKKSANNREGERLVARAR